jgi:hypothetical protein
MANDNNYLNDTQMEKLLARSISIIFHPLLLPTLGLLLLFQTDLYITFLSGTLKQVIIISTFISTGAIPALFFLTGKTLRNGVESWEKMPVQTLTYLISGVSYFAGYYLISKLPVAGFFNAIFLAGTLVLVALALISLRWNISSHMTALGALFGVALSIMLRLGQHDMMLIGLILLAGGFTGYARLVMGKNNPAQVYAGYILGFSILFLIFNFV